MRDLVGTVIYLCSDLRAFTTDQTFNVDGGANSYGSSSNCCGTGSAGVISSAPSFSHELTRGFTGQAELIFRTKDSGG